MIKIYQVAGMSCSGCARSVEAAITAVAPGAQVVVDLDCGRVTVQGADDADAIRKAVDAAGFQVVGEVAGERPGEPESRSPAT